MEPPPHAVDHKAALHTEEPVQPIVSASGTDKLEGDVPDDPPLIADPVDAPSALEPSTSNSALETAYLSEEGTDHIGQPAPKHAAEAPQQSGKHVPLPQHGD